MTTAPGHDCGEPMCYTCSDTKRVPLGSGDEPCPVCTPAQATGRGDVLPERIDCDEGGIDDLWLPEHGLHLERMSDGCYWMKIGNHVFNFHTKRGAQIRATYCNEATGAERGFQERKP